MLRGKTPTRDSELSRCVHLGDRFDYQWYLRSSVILAFDAGSKDYTGFSLDHVCGKGWGDLEVEDKRKNNIFHPNGLAPRKRYFRS